MWVDYLLEDRYEVLQQIGKGGFGEVYMGFDHESECKVAIKIEDYNIYNSYLEEEYEVYSELKGEGSIGITDIELYGSDSFICYMVMDLLGPDLEELLSKCSGKFSLKTVLLLADQMIRIIQYVHSKDYIHGDIKPGNFLLGREKSKQTLYMVDYGLAQKYRDPQTKEHIPYNDTASYGGTTRYKSLNSHQHIQLSRRDDMESLGYVLIYFLRGNLPWQGITVSEGSDNKKEKRRLVYEKKVSTSIEELCTGQPSEFVTYMKYCSSLQFDEEPDYSYLRKLFKDLFERSGFTEDNQFDWTVLGKTGGIYKFLNDSRINSSDVEPWEMKLYLQVSYSTFPAVSNINEATVEEYVAEAFRFTFPEGVPSYFTRYYTNGATWKSVAPQLCSEFFTNKSDWLKNNFKLNYNDSSYTDIAAQERVIFEGVNDISDESIRLSSDLALSIHRLVRSFVLNEEGRAIINENWKEKQKHDRILFVIYDMLLYAGVTFLSDGFSEYEMKLGCIPGRDADKGGLTIKAAPDATLCVRRSPYILKDYPYCTVQVHGTYNDKGCEQIQTTSSESSRSSQTTSSKPELNTRFNNLSLSGDRKDGDSVCYNVEHEMINSAIKNKTPFKHWPPHTFCKVTGQFVAEMYAILLEAERLHSTNDGMCECMGIFVQNENIYLAKMQQKQNEVKLLLSKCRYLGGEGPHVCYSDWFFDLRKPNARLGFLIFMYHYKVIIRCRKKIPDYFKA